FDPVAARAVDVPGQASDHRQELADAVRLVRAVSLGGASCCGCSELAIVDHAATLSKACGSWGEGRPGAGAAGPPITLMTSIGWAGGSSAIDSTVQAGARSLSSAARAR